MGYIAGKNLGKYRDDWVRFVKRTKRDRGTYSNLKADDFKKNLIDLENENPSLLMIPTAGKDSKLYTYFPADGSADFTVSRNSTKWVLGKNGYLYEVPANQPAIRFNADGSYRGVLIEPQSTNYIGNSTSFNFSNADEYMDELAPDGTLTATRVVETTTDSARYFSTRTFGDTTYRWDNRNFVVSCYVKKYGRNERVYIGFRDRTNVLGTVEFNLTTQQVGRIETANATIRNYGIENVGNGWYRVFSSWFYSAYASSTRANHRIYIGGPGSINDIYSTDKTAYVGDGESGIIVWGFQVEMGTKPSSYIPTTNSISTRAADVITLNNASNFIPQTGKITIGWEQEQNDTMYVGALSASVDAGVRKLEFEYSPTYQKLYIDDTLQQTINGSYDWSDIDSISLGHLDESQQPSLDLKYFSIN